MGEGTSPWIARGRAWLVVASLVATVVPLLCVMGELAEARGASSHGAHLLAHGAIVAGLVCLLRGVPAGDQRWAVGGALFLSLGHLGAWILSLVTQSFLAELSGEHASDASGWLVVLAACLAHGALFSAIALVGRRTLPIAGVLGVVAAGATFVPRLLTFVGERMGDEGGSFGSGEHRIHLSISGMTGDTIRFALFVGLGALAAWLLAPGVDPAADVPEASREPAAGLRSFVFLARLRALAVLFAAMLGLIAALDLAYVERATLALVVVSLATGPLLLRAMVRMRRAEATRGPATVALVFGVLHALADAPWLIFLLFARGMGGSDAEVLPFMALAALVTGAGVDSAAAAVASRLGATLGAAVSGGRMQGLTIGAYLCATCLGGGAVALTLNASRTEESLLYLVAAFFLGLAGLLRTLAQREMLRATQLA